MNENVEELQKLTSRHIEAINMMVAGLSNEDIAKKLEVTSNTVYRWKKQRIFKEKLDEIQEDISNEAYFKLGTLSIKAVEVLEGLLNNAKNENNKLKASTYILDKLLELEALNMKSELDYILELFIRSKMK